MTTVSAMRSTRCVYPVLPALALCAADWLGRSFPRLSAALVRVVAPLAAAVGAALSDAERHWRLANPLLYYQERRLAPSSESAAGAPVVLDGGGGLALDVLDAAPRNARK